MTSGKSLMLIPAAQDPLAGWRARGGYLAAMTETERLEASLGRAMTRMELAAFHSVRNVETFA